MKKVSLYVREHSTRKLVRANSKTTYPMDATFVLRYGGKWETLRGHHTFAEASVAAQRKQLNLFTGEETITLSPRPRSGALDSSIDAYLDSTAEHKSHKTWLAYSKALRGFYASCRCASLAAITLETLKAFVSKMRKENLSDRTIANRLANVVCFLKTHKIDVSLTHPYVEKTVRAYREDEVRAFFKACQKYPEQWLLYQFFLCTGAREQEVMHVHYSDIDYKDSIYNVTAKANWRPKDLAEREIPIPTHLVEALQERRKTATSKLIFPMPKGKHAGPHPLAGRSLTARASCPRLQSSVRAIIIRYGGPRWTLRLWADCRQPGSNPLLPGCP